LTEGRQAAVSSADGVLAEVTWMKARIGRLWQPGRGRGAQADRPNSEVTLPGADGPSVDDDTADAGDLALPEAARTTALVPEQPVLLRPSGDARPVRVGELLPARRSRWPLTLLRLPAVPKRAILAAGVCAGLAAPGLARHLAARLLLGRPASRPEGVLEITRIIYTGPLTPRASSAISKALVAARR
jgi:hypothetical protein